MEDLSPFDRNSIAQFETPREDKSTFSNVSKTKITSPSQQISLS